MKFVNRLAAKLVASTAVAAVNFAETVEEEFNRKREEEKTKKRIEKIEEDIERYKRLNAFYEELEVYEVSKIPAEIRKPCRMSV